MPLSLPILLLLVLMLLVQVGGNHGGFEPFINYIGSTFCMFLAYKNQLPRKYFSLCGAPDCHSGPPRNTEYEGPGIFLPF